MTEVPKASNESRLPFVTGYLNTGLLAFLFVPDLPVFSVKMVLLVLLPLKPITLPSTVSSEIRYFMVCIIGLPIIYSRMKPPMMSRILNIITVDGFMIDYFAE